MLDAGGLGGGAVLLGLLLEAARLGGLRWRSSAGLGGLALGLRSLALGVGAGVGSHRGGHRRAVLGVLHLGRRSWTRARSSPASRRRASASRRRAAETNNQMITAMTTTATTTHSTVLPVSDMPFPSRITGPRDHVPRNLLRGARAAQAPSPADASDAPALSQAELSAVVSRISTLRTLPVTVIGNSSTICDVARDLVVRELAGGRTRAATRP